MKKYNASVSGMQLSIWDYIKEIDQEQKEKLAQSAIDQKARTGTDDWCPMSGIASGNVIVMPNRNKGMIQTGMPIESNILRHNPKTKELESVPVLKIPGKLSSEYLPTVCPHCGAPLYKHGNRPIQISDIPMGSIRTYLVVDRDRYICSNPECKYTVTPDLPFTMSDHKVTKSMETYTRDLLGMGLTLKTVSQLTGLTPFIVKEIDKARLSEIYLDENGKLKRPEQHARYVGVDEFLLHEGYHFATVFMDLETGHVLYLTEGKKKAGIDNFMDFVGDDWMQHVEAIACDMNADFAEAFKARYPNIDVVYDFFHIVKNFNDRVMSEIRRDEHAQLLIDGDEEGAKLLKGSRHILTSNLETLEVRDKEGREGKVANKGSSVFGISESKHEECNREERLWAILEKNELLLRAYIIKEMLTAAYKCTTVETMEKYLIEIVILCKEGKNKHLSWFERLIGRHWQGIINHAVYGISSGIVEGTNRKIKTIRWQAYGLPDDEYFFLKIIDATR